MLVQEPCAENDEEEVGRRLFPLHEVQMRSLRKAREARRHR